MIGDIEELLCFNFFLITKIVIVSKFTSYV